MADVLRDWMIESYPSAKSESPMEALLFAGWEMMRHRLMLDPLAGLRLEQQGRVGKYRADFLFQLKDEAGKPVALVVEVDGHDFHERTKQQAAHDKSRDRWMTANGYVVLRFTGSEVYANPFVCAIEISERIHCLRYGRSRKEALARAGFAAIEALLRDNT
jgi:very-short-patch-repair endonuclease